MLSLLFSLLLGAPPGAGTPVRLAHDAFGRSIEIEVRGASGDAARAAIQKAFLEVAEMERLTDPARPDGGLTVLNAAAGKGPQPADPRLVAALARARSFCYWSEFLYGPLGRDLNALYSVRSPAADSEPPSPERLAQVVPLATCNRMLVDTVKNTVDLAAGSAFDLWGFAEGAAVDRAVDVLRQQGMTNGFVRIGPVQRGFGPGAGGKGWILDLPLVPGQEESAGRVVLLDRSLAVVLQADRSYVNHRTGQPGKGALATAVVTELAMDAQGLATTMMVAGPREGQLRLGSLQPRPSVLWFMGSGTGVPLQVDYHWGRAGRN
ncbi:MAG: FAD:protein FMN transferase [Thermoanaerobaculia bacterium]